MAKQNTRDALQAKKEADRIFSEKQQLKAQRVKEDGRKLQDFNATQMVMFKLQHVITKKNSFGLVVVFSERKLLSFKCRLKKVPGISSSEERNTSLRRRMQNSQPKRKTSFNSTRSTSSTQRWRLSETCFHFAKLQGKGSEEGLVPSLVESGRATSFRTLLVLKCPNTSLVPPRTLKSFMTL